MTSLTAVSPDSNILAVYTPPSKDKGGSSSKIIIKCYDAKVSLGALKYTLSAKQTKNDSSAVDGILFASPRTLLASTGTGSGSTEAKIFIFDLVRGVHAHTIAISSGMHLQSVDAKEDSVYALVKKDGKALVLKYNIGSKPKLVKKIKTGSCDDDDILSVCIAGDNDNDDEDEESVAVRVGNKIKIVNSNTGVTGMKFKIKSKDADTYTKSAVASSSALEVSSDGGLILASTSNALHLFSTNTSNAASAPDKSARSIIGVAKIPNVTKVYIHTIQSGKEYIVSCCSGNGDGQSSEAKLLHVKTGGNKKKSNVKSFASITPLSMTSANSKSSSSLLAFFAQQEIIMAELTMVGFTNVTVQMTRLSYRNDDDNTNKGSLKSGNLYPIEDDEDAATEDVDMTSSSSKKRKKNIVLGPGESGGEALTVTDSTKPSKKKSKKNSDGDDMDDFALEDEEGDGDGDGDGGDNPNNTTIAERLALLSSELEREDSDEDDYLLRHGDAKGNGNSNDSTALVNGSSKFMVKAATSGSLVILLRQALLANDDSQLEVALQVTDKRVIENSIMELSSSGSSSTNAGNSTAEDSGSGEMIVMLLTKLVTRISRKPARAEPLSFWIRTVLVALLSSNSSNANEDGFSMGKAEKDIAARLAPLRSMLSERVESLPALLRLEGRLGLIGKQF